MKQQQQQQQQRANPCFCEADCYCISALSITLPSPHLLSSLVECGGEAFIEHLLTKTTKYHLCTAVLARAGFLLGLFITFCGALQSSIIAPTCVRQSSPTLVGTVRSFVMPRDIVTVRRQSVFLFQECGSRLGPRPASSSAQCF